MKPTVSDDFLTFLQINTLQDWDVAAPSCVSALAACLPVFNSLHCKVVLYN